MKSSAWTAPLLILALAAFSPAQSDVRSAIERVENGLLPPVIVKGEPGWSIQERMKHYKVPGVSVAVIRDFRVEWVMAYGVKDAESGESISRETLFQAGSISKPVAAMAALKKVQERKLALDEDINLKLISWKIPDNELTAKKKVTLANLLSHTAGLTVHGFPGYPTGAPLPTVPQVLDGAAPANTAPVRVDMEPGTKFRYSGGGTTVMQLALTDVEKKPFPRIARETVLEPLTMKNSTYEQPLPPELLESAAAGHRMSGDPVKTKRHVYPEMAAAGLWTTPMDLAKFAIDVQLTVAGKSSRVLSREMASKMITPVLESAPGLGFFLEKKGNATYFGHGGADEGFRAALTAHLDKGYGAVVMVNSDNGQIINEILRAIAREYRWESYLPEPVETVRVEAATLDAYAGRYLVNPDRVLTVTREGEKLIAEPTASAKFELRAVSDTRFIRTDADTRYTFRAAGTEPAAAVQIDFDGGSSDAARITDSRRIPYERLMTGDVRTAADEYRAIKRNTPDNVAVAEQRLNGLGYELLRAKKVAGAIAIFELNVELYPGAWNTHDSLGEAYVAAGKRDLAIASYKKSLELNPANVAARAALKKLEN